jgi:hypothetical protein
MDKISCVLLWLSAFRDPPGQEREQQSEADECVVFAQQALSSFIRSIVSLPVISVAPVVAIATPVMVVRIAPKTAAKGCKRSQQDN